MSIRNRLIWALIAALCVHTAPADGIGNAQVVGGAEGINNASASAAPPSTAPTVTVVLPTSGPTAGGTSVAISGTNYGVGGASVTAIKFGATNAASFSCSSSIACSATSPAASAGTVDVTVTTPSGTSSTSSADQFTYIAPTTTFDPSFNPGSYTLSNGNLTIVGTNAAGLVRTLTSHTTGKYYAEFTINTAAASYQADAGIANSSETTTVGTTTNSAGLLNGDPNVYINNVSAGTAVTYAASQVVSMALDIGNKTIWYRVNGGNWNGSGAANPATNTGGVSISAVTGAYFMAASVPGAGSPSMTANFGATAYSYTPSAGFGNW